MPSGAHVKTKMLASSSRMAAFRDQRRELGFDVIEQADKRALLAESLGLCRLFNLLARLKARRVMSEVEAWRLTHVTVLSRTLTKTAACVSGRVQSFLSDRLALLSSSMDGRPQVLRPDVGSGVEPGANLSF